MAADGIVLPTQAQPCLGVACKASESAREHGTGDRVTDLGVVRWIRELDETGAVALSRSLIRAEAGRLALPLGDFSMSARVKVGDQGVDGRTHFPDDSGGLLPTGQQVWQVKSGSSTPDAAKEFDPKHTALIDAIREGSNYVLFWTNDPVDPTATTVRTNFQNKVQAIRADAKATFLFADAIERLCYAHFAVLSQVPAMPLGGVLSLRVWGQRQDFGIPFQTDDQRSQHTDAIRRHVKSEDSGSAALHLYGDTGVGKSRLVYEALAEVGVVERVLVALDPADFDRNVLRLVAASPERRLILVVDDCTAEDRQAIARYSDLAQGRIRLITIGSRYSRDPQPTDARYLEILPLAAAASREIALSVGLSSRDADSVAHFTEGYPKLAFVLAEAISRGGPTGNLLERVRSEAVGSVLSSMLTNPDDIVLLGGLALFERLGFDGDLAQEATIACEALDIDEEAFREVVGRELLRFVSSAGRYRLVTPRLFAVWLASQFIQRNRKLADALQGLPETLRDRMIEQMKAFAGDKHVGRALRQLFEQPPFTSGVLDDVDEGSARLLHVAAIVDPALAMDIIDSIMADHSDEELRTDLRRGRRGFVDSLAVLIWFDETFERAAAALLRLAVAENETWGNNATRTVQGIFRVHLGGTSAPYTRRLSWARSALIESSESEPILIQGLANGLNAHEMRLTPEFASRSAPPEWRPREIGEEVDARRGAWRILIELALAGRNIDAIAEALAAGLRTAAARGLADDVLSDLATITWPPSARALLGEALGHLLKYDEPDQDMAARFQGLLTRIVGSTLDEQLTYLLSKEPWQLYEAGQPDQLSPFLTQVAVQLVAAGEPAILDAARKSRTGEFRTTSLLFERIGIGLPDERLQIALESEDPLLEAAVLGIFVGLVKGLGAPWARDNLRRWLREGLGRLVIQAVHLLPADGELAELAIQAVREGYSDPRELGRFLYGAWARSLSVTHVASIARILGQTGQVSAIEQGLGILSQWLDDHPEHETSDLDSVASDLISATTGGSSQGSSMIAFYRHRVLTRLNISFDAQLDIISGVLSNLDSPPAEGDLQMIDSLASERPARTIAEMLRIIIGDDDHGFVPGVLWLESSKVLTRLALATSFQDVANAIGKIPQDRWRRLVSHVSFAQAEPDPLIESLVIKSTDDVVRTRAAFSFVYPESGWIGQESDYLRKRRSVAISWLNRATLPQMQQWLRGLVDELDARIASVLLAEAEEDG